MAALLNSVIARFIVANYCALHPSPHIMEYISIEKFTFKKPQHVQLSDLSRNCHRAASKGDEKLKGSLESKINEVAAELWSIKSKELDQIEQALKES